MAIKMKHLAYKTLTTLTLLYCLCKYSFHVRCVLFFHAADIMNGSVTYSDICKGPFFIHMFDMHVLHTFYMRLPLLRRKACDALCISRCFPFSPQRSDDAFSLRSVSTSDRLLPAHLQPCKSASSRLPHRSVDRSLQRALLFLMRTAVYLLAQIGRV